MPTSPRPPNTVRLEINLPTALAAKLEARCTRIYAGLFEHHPRGARTRHVIAALELWLDGPDGLYSAARPDWLRALLQQ